MYFPVLLDFRYNVATKSRRRQYDFNKRGNQGIREFSVPGGKKRGDAGGDYPAGIDSQTGKRDIVTLSAVRIIQHRA